jgi:hypothetical protein
MGVEKDVLEDGKPLKGVTGLPDKYEMAPLNGP